MNQALSDALNKHLAVVSALEFELQKRKMVEVQGWSQDAVEIMEREYRKFLALSAALESLNSDVAIVPNRTIDLFWHAHIMDTEKYHKDCDTVFGHYLHHFPYFGMQDETDTENWHGASFTTSNLWNEAFGEDIFEDNEEEDAYSSDKQWAADLSAAIVSSTISPPKRCMRRNCKPQKCK